jgi:hypothetical protein
MGVSDLKKEVEAAGAIKADGLGLATATIFLGGTMAGTGVLALARAMVESGGKSCGVTLVSVLKGLSNQIRFD